MAFEKTIKARILGVTQQPGSFTGLMPIGDSSGGVETLYPNPLRATRFWDTCQYILTGISVGGGATGGSWTVTLFTNAIAGITGLPIAERTLMGPNSAPTQVLTNLHNSSSSPIPTHFLATQTAAGGNISFQLHAIARQYRGVLSTSGSRSSERILEGVIFSTNKAFGAAGLNASTNIPITASGTSAGHLGMDKMELWDNVMFWALAGETIAGGGTAAAAVTGIIEGVTYTVAATSTGALDTAGEKIAIPSNLYGSSPRLTHIVWTRGVAGGFSDARVVMLAKSGRGSNVGRG